MDIKDSIEQSKINTILAQMGPGMGGGAPGGGGGSVASSPIATPPFGQVSKVDPSVGGGGGAAGGPKMPSKPPMGGPQGPGGPKPPMGAPQGPMKANPSPQPMVSNSPQQNPAESRREKEVRRALENLRGVVMEIAATIYQLPLTEEQVRDLASKLLHTVSERIGEVTVDRVLEIGHDLIGGIDNKKK